MELIYRATTYNYNPNKTPTRPFQQVREAGAVYNKNYHAFTYRVDPNVKQSKVFAGSAAYELIYRGMTYSINRNEQGEVIAITSSANRSSKWLTTLRKLVLN